MVVLLLLVILSFALPTLATTTTEPPSILVLPLYRHDYVNVFVSGEGSARLMRIRTGENKIVLYGSPNSATYDFMSGTEELLFFGPAARFRLKTTYTYQGDPSVDDPVETNQRVTYGGVLGLGPLSPLLHWYDSWRWERESLILGGGSEVNTSTLPRGVTINPSTDYTRVSDLRIFLRWAELLPAAHDHENETMANALALLQDASGSQAAFSASAETLIDVIKVYERTHFIGGTVLDSEPTLTKAMVIPLEGGALGIELDAYGLDSVSGYYVELVRFVPAPAPSPNAKRSLEDDWPVIEVGLLHASDHTIISLADQSVVTLTASNSGPFRPRQIDFTWLAGACVLLSLLHWPGISERVHRARRLHMPFALTAQQVVEELWKAVEDWTLLHLITRITLVCAVWTIHASLVIYRTMQDFGHRGWWAAYYGSLSYIIVQVLFGSIRYPDRHSAARYTAALYLAAMLLLVAQFEDLVNVIDIVILSAFAFRVVADKCLTDWQRPDGDSDGKVDGFQYYLTAGISTLETLFFGWLAAFYAFDHFVRMEWAGNVVSVLVELTALLLWWAKMVYQVVNQEETARIGANSRFIANQVSERLATELARQKEARIKGSQAVASPKPASSAIGGAPPSAPVAYHFGMGLPSLLSDGDSAGGNA